MLVHSPLTAPFASRHYALTSEVAVLVGRNTLGSPKVAIDDSKTSCRCSKTCPPNINKRFQFLDVGLSATERPACSLTSFFHSRLLICCSAPASLARLACSLDAASSPAATLSLSSAASF